MLVNFKRLPDVAEALTHLPQLHSLGFKVQAAKAHTPTLQLVALRFSTAACTCARLHNQKGNVWYGFSTFNFDNRSVTSAHSPCGMQPQS